MEYWHKSCKELTREGNIDNQLTTFISIGVLALILLQGVLSVLLVNFVGKSVAGDNARTNEEKTKIIAKMDHELTLAFNEISLLYTVSQYLSATLEMDEFMASVQKIFCERFPCDGFVLLFRDDEHKGMKIVLAKGIHVLEGEKTRWPVDGLVEKVLHKNNSCYWHDCQEIDFSLSPMDQNLTGANLEKAVFALPLKVHGAIMGVLILSRQTPFIMTERQSLESIVSQIAMTHERVSLYTKTKELAVRDELTGVYNRRHFQYILQRECQRSRRYGNLFCLLVIDVDNFKQFNDSFGHLKGDELLRGLALLLQKNIREIDVLARIGGEEFVVLLTDVSLDQGGAIANQLRKLVKANLCIDDLSGHDIVVRRLPTVTISVGVASFPDQAKNALELINTADMALYLAKHQGKDRAVVYQTEALPSCIDKICQTKNPSV